MRKGEKGDITKFTKPFWQTVVAYGGADPKLVRDYDILTDRKKGLSYSQLSIKYNIARVNIIEICKAIK